MSDVSVTKSEVGYEDLNLATGGTGAAETFTRKTSVGGDVTITKLDASHINFRSPILGTHRSLENVATADYIAYNRTTIDSQITAIGSTEATLRIVAPLSTDTSSLAISTDLTIPANVTLVMERGAILRIANTITLTVNGQIEAGDYQIFAWTGTGTVAFGTACEVKAAWFGASTSLVDNSTAMGKALTCTPAGGSLTITGGTFTFTSALMSATAPNMHITIKGKGRAFVAENPNTKIAALSGGTILKYTGASTFLAIEVLAAAAVNGGWQFKDFSIWCSDAAASAVIFNDMTSTMPAATHRIIRDIEFDNVAIFGGGTVGSAGGYGIAALGAYNMHVKKNCLIRNFARLVYLLDCDLNTIEPRMLGGDRYIHCETSTPASYEYGNENVFRNALHYSLDYGEAADHYQIWDNAYGSKYEAMQIEGGNTNGLTVTQLWLDGFWTVFDSCRWSRNGTDTVTSVGQIGPLAREVTFRNCSGFPYTAIDTAWPKFVIDDVSAPYGDVDYSVYFEGCSQRMMALLPEYHPRLTNGIRRNSRPGLTGWDTETDQRTSWPARSDNVIDALAAQARLGLGHLRRCDYHATPQARNFTGTTAYCAATVEADADGHAGYAIKLSGTSGHTVGFSYVAGKDILETDSLAWECRYKVDAGPAVGTYIRIRNATTAVLLHSEQVGVETSYTIAQGVINLYDYAGSISAGDVIQAYFVNLDAGKYTYLSNFSLFPEAQYVRALRQVTKRQTVTYAAAVTPDLNSGSIVEIDCAANAAITINKPTNGITGQKWTLDIIKAANALTITWGAGIKGDAATMAVSASKRVLIDFVYDGTNYRLCNTPIETTL